MRENNEKEDISFSVLIANYNCASYLENSIESVLSQSYKNWEIIIIDDCSTDHSVKLIQPYLKNKKIKFFKHKSNLGYGASLKTATEHTFNDIFLILDADDKLHVSALEKLAKVYRNHPKYGFVYTNMWECDSNLQNCIKCSWIGPISPEKSNIFKDKISHLKSFRREAYYKTSGFDPKFKKAVDKDIIYKLEEITNFKFINTPLYYYRWHGKGISQSKNSYLAEYYHYLAKLDAYKRRLNTKVPNLTKKQIMFEYYRMVFYKLTHFFIRLFRKITLD